MHHFDQRVAVGLVGVALSGAGADTDNIIANSVTSYIDDSSVITESPRTRAYRSFPRGRTTSRYSPYARVSPGFTKTAFVSFMLAPPLLGLVGTIMALGRRNALQFLGKL